MLRSVAVVRTDVSEEYIYSIIRVTRIGELGTTLAVTNIQRTLRLHAVTYVVFLRSVRRLLVTSNVVPSPPILATLMMEVICSPETSVLTRATRFNNPEYGILHTHSREIIKSANLQCRHEELF
jgi:hypothetical protein